MPRSRELWFLSRHLRLHMERRVQPLRWMPAADVHQGRDGWLIKLELAGVRPEDVRLRVCGNYLAVSGRRYDHFLGGDWRLQSMEITYGEFERGFEFPVNIENARLMTEFRDGMLLVRIQREA